MVVEAKTALRDPNRSLATNLLLAIPVLLFIASGVQPSCMPTGPTTIAVAAVNAAHGPWHPASPDAASKPAKSSDVIGGWSSALSPGSTSSDASPYATNDVPYERRLEIH